MDRKDRIDTFGAVALTAFAAFLAFNQVVIKVVNDGLQPVFSAGLRSVLAFGIMVTLTVLLKRGNWPTRTTLGPGLLIGLLFSVEFLCLYLALDLTTVSRTAVIFYSMPVWMAVMAHFLLPGDRMTGPKAVGLALAMAGVAWAIFDRSDSGPDSGVASLTGDLLALGSAISWAGIALVAKGSALRTATPMTQLCWQLGVSGILLMAAAPFFGPFIREFTALTAWGLAFHVVVVASAGFLFWLWLLSIYPASGVASFSFLSPIFGVFLGWAMLGEKVGPGTLMALVLVSVGLVLINRKTA
ncbi:MAG: DMT family transporter [Pseudomonadota bacterium]